MQLAELWQHYTRATQRILLSLLPPPLGTGLLPLCTSTLMSLLSDPSVFDILNLFRCQWFLSRDWLVSNITSAQRTDDSSIDWVEFPPAAHTHLVQCAIKLAPSVPAAKVKWVMFIFILEVLNGDGPVSSFFAPRHVHVPRKQRARKPREAGDQPVSAMAVDSPPPITPSQPDPPGPLSPGLVPGNGDPSSEEQAGDGFNVISGRASSSPGVSLTPSDRTVVPVSPSWPGPSHPPSVLGVKHSPLPASPPPPPPLPPGLPSSPPPPLVPFWPSSHKTGGTGLRRTASLLVTPTLAVELVRRMSRVSCSRRLRTRAPLPL